MYNSSQFLDAFGNLNREAVRAHFLRVGRLDGLSRGDDVWIDDGKQWVMGRLVRRLPGDVWAVRVRGYSQFSGKTICTVANFGGKCL